MSTLKVNTLTDTAATKSVPIEDVVNGTARAWVNFDGTGTVAIRASYNVSSITDNSTGNYTVNFTTALSDANYAAVCSAGNAGNYNMTAYVLTTSSVRLSTTYEISGPYDTTIVQLAVFR